MAAKPQNIDKKTVAAARAIAAELPSGAIKLEGVAHPLPPAVAAMLRDMLASIASGKAVGLVTNEHEMTPNEAAGRLNISRGSITKMLDDGALPFRMVGSHRRIPAAAVIAHALESRLKAETAMNELVRLSEEMGLYDMNPRMLRGRNERKK